MRPRDCLLATRAALAVLLALLLAVPAAHAQTRPVSLRDSFPIGSNGLCEAQIEDARPGAGLFDRSYAVVCRDAAAPVGRLWVVRGAVPASPAERFLPDQDDCVASQDAILPVQLAAGTVLSCRGESGVARLLAVGSSGNRTYAGEAVSAYRDVIRLGLETLASDRLATGTVEIPLTDAGDAASYARTRAAAIAGDAALGEAYRHSNAGEFAQAAEFFAASAQALQGNAGMEATLNAALQQSNLGNFAEAERLFAGVRGMAAANPVLARMLRNYEVIDALNAGDPGYALKLLDAPVADTLADSIDPQALAISPELADRLTAEQPDMLAATGALTLLERMDLLDGQAQFLRATALRLNRQPAEAAQALVAADAVLSGVRGGRVSSIAWLRAQALAELADLSEEAGKPGEAEATHRSAIALLERAYPGSPALLSARALLAGFYARAGRSDDAKTLFAALVDEADETPAPSLRRLLAPYFAMLVDPGAASGDDAAALFVASQLLQRPGLAQTQAVLARELSGGDDAAAQLFRKAVNVRRALEQGRNAVASLEGAVGDNPLLQERLAQRQAEVAALTERQLALQDELGKYPRYRAVSSGRLGLAELQATLHPREAYLKLVTLDRATYAIFADPAGARAYRVALSPAQLASAVQTIRDSIAIEENGQIVTGPFALAEARALYVALLGPVEDRLGAVDHLIFDPDGAMLALPLNLLVTDEASVALPAAKAASLDYTGTKWLGRRVQVSTSVSPVAFRDVRAAPRSSAGREYIGFGENAPLGAAGGMLGTRSAIAGGSDCLWAPALWDHPIRPDELYAAAQSLGSTAATQAIVTGAAFSDRALLQRTDLADFRILHFATHGLVTAPQPQCPPRPALLTSFGGEGSDGLLSFAEIFDLHLDADLVVLSACDTAGTADAGATREAGLVGGGGYALDGLVRAFTGAGGRSIIASHWPVPDEFDATDRLVGGLFRAPADASVAQALQASERALMDDPRTSHPFYWAAFAIVGDGAAKLRR